MSDTAGNRGETPACYHGVRYRGRVHSGQEVAMYTPHDLLHEPSQDNIRLWRYYDFAKFVSFLDKKSLYFARLSEMDDPYEGVIPEGSLSDLKKRTGRHDVQTKVTNYTKQFMANCWHMNKYESEAMWQIYAGKGSGIAIQTTYQKLKESIIDSRDVYLGEVRYVDYKTTKLDNNNFWTIVMHKRISFSHEHELRAIVDGNKYAAEGEETEKGIYIQVNVESLIENIYVAPQSPDWFMDAVNSVVNRYGYGFAAQRSRMDDPVP